MKRTAFPAILVLSILLNIDVASAGDSTLDWNRAWHGRLMVLAWAVLFPIGIIAARFFKVLPWQRWPQELDNQVWWNTHRLAQYSGMIVLALAIWLIWTAPVDAAKVNLIHRWIGWCLVAAAVAQLLGGLLRGTKGGPTDRSQDGSLFGDHYYMTQRRRAFEAIHKSVGYIAMGLSPVAVFSGLNAADAPIWMWVALCCWWGLLVVLWIVLERRIKRIETYEAIWGPDSAHPGNQADHQG